MPPSSPRISNNERLKSTSRSNYQEGPNLIIGGKTHQQSVSISTLHRSALDYDLSISILILGKRGALTTRTAEDGFGEGHKREIWEKNAMSPPRRGTAWTEFRKWIQSEIILTLDEIKKQINWKFQSILWNILEKFVQLFKSWGGVDSPIQRSHWMKLKVCPSLSVIRFDTFC